MTNIACFSNLQNPDLYIHVYSWTPEGDCGMSKVTIRREEEEEGRKRRRGLRESGAPRDRNGILGCSSVVLVPYFSSLPGF